MISRKCVRAAPALLVVVVATSVSSAGEVLAADPLRHESKHYVLISDLGKRVEIRRILSFLEAMHSSYRRVFPQDPVREVPRATVRVLAHQEDYLQFGSTHSAEYFNQNWRGYYCRDHHELITYRGETLADLFSILSHEGVHQFMRQYAWPEESDRLPDWYEEGLGEYFRTTSQRGGRLRHVRQDYHYQRVRRAIREGWVWTLEQILQCDPAQVEDPGVFDAYYAHAYVFVDLLQKEAPQKVIEIYRLKREGRESAQIMEEVFGETDRARLHRAFLEHASKS